MFNSAKSLVSLFVLVALVGCGSSDDASLGELHVNDPSNTGAAGSSGSPPSPSGTAGQAGSAGAQAAQECVADSDCATYNHGCTFYACLKGHCVVGADACDGPGGSSGNGGAPGKGGSAGVAGSAGSPAGAGGAVQNAKPTVKVSLDGKTAAGMNLCPGSKNVESFSFDVFPTLINPNPQQVVGLELTKVIVHRFGVGSMKDIVSATLSTSKASYQGQLFEQTNEILFTGLSAPVYGYENTKFTLTVSYAPSATPDNQSGFGIDSVNDLAFNQQVVYDAAFPIHGNVFTVSGNSQFCNMGSGGVAGAGGSPSAALLVAFTGPTTGEVKAGTPGHVFYKTELTDVSGVDFEIRKLPIEIACDNGAVVKGSKGTPTFDNIKVLHKGATVMGPLKLDASVPNGATSAQVDFTDSFVITPGQTMPLEVAMDVSGTEDAPGELFGKACHVRFKGFGSSDVRVVETGEFLETSKIVPNVSVVGNAQTIVANGGMAGAGGSAGCTPELTVDDLGHATNDVEVGTPEYGTMALKFTASSCADITLNLVDTALFAVENTDASTPYCAEPCSSPSDWNFLNPKLVDLATQTVVMQAEGFKTITGNGGNKIRVAPMKGELQIKAGESRSVSVKLDVASPLKTDIIGKEYVTTFMDLGVKGAKISLKANLQTNLPAFKVVANVDGPGGSGGAAGSGGTGGSAGAPAGDMLTVKLASDAPMPTIVTPTTNSGCLHPFTTYVVENGSDTDLTLGKVSVDQMNGNGDMADFISVSVGDVSGAPGWSFQAEGSIVSTTEVDPNAYFKTKGPFTKDFSEGPATIVIPAHGSKKLALWGCMARPRSSDETNGAWFGAPRSGHTPALQITHLEAGGVTAKIEPHTASVMVLRKSFPVVTKQALQSTVLVNGMQDAYRFTVQAGADSMVALKQLSFQCTTSTEVAIGNVLLQKDAAELTKPYIATGWFSSEADPWKPTIGTYTDAKATMYSGVPASKTFAFTLGYGEEELASNVASTYTLWLQATGAVAGSYLGCKLLPGTEQIMTGYLAPSLLPSGDVSFVQVLGNLPQGGTVWESGFLWSDMSETPHNGYWGSYSSNDWTNGYLLQDLKPFSTKSL